MLPDPNLDLKMLHVASRTAELSPDPHRKVGCVIVDPTSHAILATGCNSPAKGIPLTTPGLKDKTDKHLYMVHAEQRAALNLKVGLKSVWAYTYERWPCAGCVRCLLEVGLTRLVLIDGPESGATNSRSSPAIREGMQLLNLAKINVVMVPDSQYRRFFNGASPVHTTRHLEKALGK